MAKKQTEDAAVEKHPVDKRAEYDELQNAQRGADDPQAPGLEPLDHVTTRDEIREGGPGPRPQA